MSISPEALHFRIVMPVGLLIYVKSPEFCYFLSRGGIKTPVRINKAATDIAAILAGERIVIKSVLSLQNNKWCQSNFHSS